MQLHFGSHDYNWLLLPALLIAITCINYTDKIHSLNTIGLTYSLTISFFLLTNHSEKNMDLYPDSQSHRSRILPDSLFCENIRIPTMTGLVISMIPFDIAICERVFDFALSEYNYGYDPMDRPYYMTVIFSFILIVFVTSMTIFLLLPSDQLDGIYKKTMIILLCITNYVFKDDLDFDIYWDLRQLIYFPFVNELINILFPVLLMLGCTMSYYLKKILN